MRFLVAIITAVSVLASGVIPWHRCAPEGKSGGGAVVVVGSHAHDGDHDCDHHRGSDEVPCCVDSPQDPTGLPTVSAWDLELPQSDMASGRVIERAPSLVADSAAWSAPVPRLPTDTVVLLR